MFQTHANLGTRCLHIAFRSYVSNIDNSVSLSKYMSMVYRQTDYCL